MTCLKLLTTLENKIFQDIDEDNKFYLENDNICILRLI